MKEATVTQPTVIKKAFDESASLKWPPTADEIGALTQDQLPKELLKFLNVVFPGREPDSEKCGKTHRMIYSIGEDKSRVITNGGWKHIFICLKIFHLSHIKQLSQILNKMRHCKSYQYGLEVETAFAETLDNKNKLASDAPYCDGSTLVFHMSGTASIR